MADTKQLVTDRMNMETQGETRDVYSNVGVNSAASAQMGGPLPAYVAQPPTSNMTTSFKSKYVYGIGITQIVLGILSLVFQIVPCVWIDHIGAGIWCGIYFIVTGSFGIATAKSGTKCLMVTSMILNIVSAAVFVPMLFGFSIYGIAQGADYWYCYRYGCELQVPSLISYGLIIGMNIAILVISIISAYFCGCVACAKKPNTNAMMYYTAGGQPMTMLPPGQGQHQILYNNQGQQVLVSMVPQQHPATPSTTMMMSQPQDHTGVPIQTRIP